MQRNWSNSTNLTGRWLIMSWPTRNRWMILGFWKAFHWTWSLNLEVCQNPSLEFIGNYNWSLYLTVRAAPRGRGLAQMFFQPLHYVTLHYRYHSSAVTLLMAPSLHLLSRILRIIKSIAQKSEKMESVT